MSGFTPAWLELREPLDMQARNPALLVRLEDWARRRQRLVVADLGSGTGSNLRAVAPRLAVSQEWDLIEIDPMLIEAGQAALASGPPAAAGWRFVKGDLAADLETLVQPDVDLVTAAALLDLVSERWLERLVRLVRARRCALYVALSYDGRWRWRPADVFDREAHDLFERHQRRDKDFGPALGSTAAACLANAAGRLPGTCIGGTSDWRLEPEAVAMQEALLEGYIAAAEVAGGERSEVADWRRARRRHIELGRSRHSVGHRDLLYLPD